MFSFWSHLGRAAYLRPSVSILVSAMRQLADIPHPEVKITLFSWNGKYLIKLEKGQLEQTYKVSELDVVGDDEVRALLDDEFVRAAVSRFQQMRQDLQAAFDRHDV